MNLAYVAGLFDGEGCVNFSRNRSGCFIRVFVTNTNRELLESLQEKFGGDIAKLSGRKKGWKQAYVWRIAWTKAVEFLDKIQPYLCNKWRQAEVAFAWDANRLGRGNHDAAMKKEVQEANELLIDQLHWLNHRGENNTPEPIQLALAAA
jgi:hypothetical protein